MIRATLRSPAADTAASQRVASVAQPATQPAPAAALAAPRAAAPSRVPAGVITPRGGITAPRPPAAPVAPPLTRAPAAPAAATPARPAQPAAVVAAPAAVAPKVRAPRKPAAPKVETIQEQVPTPVAGVVIDTTTTIAAPAASVDAELFGQAEGEIIDVSSEVTPIEDPAGQPPAEAYPTDPLEQQVAEPAPSNAVVPRPPAGFAVATRTSYGTDGSGLEGDWGTEDLRFPQLKVVQGSGQLSAQFDNGSVIYADNLLFAPASVVAGANNPLLYFVPISVKKQWRENLSKEEQETGALPRVVDSVDEVEALGGSTLWIGNQKPGWGPSARCLFLLERPEGVDHPNFTVDLDGRQYGVAVYYAGGTAFNNSAKVIFNTGLTSLQVPVTDDAGVPQKDAQGRVQKRTMLYKNYWTIQWVRKQSGEYMVWQPQVRILAKEETGSEVRQYIESISQSRKTFDVAAEEP